MARATSQIPFFRVNALLCPRRRRTTITAISASSNLASSSSPISSVLFKNTNLGHYFSTCSFSSFLKSNKQSASSSNSGAPLPSSPSSRDQTLKSHQVTNPEEFLHLLARSGQGGRWHTNTAGNYLERIFRFNTFKATWSFMKSVALLAQEHRHHPEWSNIYNTVFIRWTTHEPCHRLTLLDVHLAQVTDQLAWDHKERIPDDIKATQNTNKENEYPSDTQNDTKYNLLRQLVEESFDVQSKKKSK